MTVHHPGALKFGVVVALAMVAIIGHRHWGISHAERVDGRVQSVRAFDGRCKGKRSGDCTWFWASVVYEVRGATYTLSEPAGFAFRYKQPITEARLQAGDTVSVAYNPTHPADHYNGGWETAPQWMVLVMLLGVAMIAVGFTKPRR